MAQSLAARSRRRFASKSLVWLVLIVMTGVLAATAEKISKRLNQVWFAGYPESWVRTPASTISRFTKWLVNDAAIGSLSFTDVTRAVSFAVEQPYNWSIAILSEGFMEGVGRRASQIVPPLSWIAVIVIVAALGHQAKNWRLEPLDTKQRIGD